MESVFLEYQDPLISIILFVSVVFTIALFTYIMNVYTTLFDKDHIQAFTKQYDNYEKESHIEALLDNNDVPLASLELLAKSYFEHANYEECVEINIELLKRHKNALKRKDTLMLLALCYFKAGFYKRAETTLIELLRYHTREPLALRYLVVIYERLQRYNDAIDLLESLDEMGESVTIEKSYFRLQKVLSNSKLTSSVQAKKALALYTPLIVRPLFTFLFRHEPVLAWESLKEEHIQELIDILWNVPQDKINFDVVANSPRLEAIYCAKGYVEREHASECGIFEVDTINRIEQSHKKSMDIHFEYICTSCKEVTPVSSVRCPYCLSLLSLQPQSTLVKRQIHQSYYSF